MRASFIIGFHTARMDNLLQTLRFMEKWHNETTKKSELILVCQDKCEHNFDNFNWLETKLFNLELENMSLPLVTNFGIDKSSSDKLVILESDRILPAGYYNEILSKLKPGIQITTKKMKRLSAPASDEKIVSEEYDFDWDNRNEIGGPGERNMWSGNTALMKSDFIKAGKMDEEYIGYGWADNDMTFSTRKAGIKSIFTEHHELHLWHPRATYGEGDQKKQFVKNGFRFIKKWKVDVPEWFQDDFREYRKGFLI